MELKRKSSKNKKYMYNVIITLIRYYKHEINYSLMLNPTRKLNTIKYY